MPANTQHAKLDLDPGELNMAKPGPKPKQAGKSNGTVAGVKQIAAEGESMSGYFRKIFKARPKLLRTRSNQELLTQWLADHPSHTEVPENVKQTLANIKSVLRHKKRAKGAKAEAPVGTAVEGAVAPAIKLRTSDLEALEQQIDDCLQAARRLNEDVLESVIRLLRKARNEVVWKLGE
jgi:hypothetical protein